MGKLENLRDTGSERAVISLIYKHGKDALIESKEVLSSKDFTLGINKAIFTAFDHLADDPNFGEFDIDSLKMKLKSIGYGKNLEDPKIIQYIELLEETKGNRDNLLVLSLQIRKLSTARELYARYEAGKSYIENITGQETISEILSNAEGSISSFLAGHDDKDSGQLTEDITSYIHELMQLEPIAQIGMDAGFPIWQKAIGGIRLGSTICTAGRMKSSKSFFALNVGRNIAKQQIPVLLLDNENTRVAQRDRLIGIESGVSIYNIETRRFKESRDQTQALIDAAEELETYPLTYHNISSSNALEVINIIKSWIIKIGRKDINEPCLVILDQLKIINNEDLKGNSSETQLIGFYILSLQNLAIKYNICILILAQTNRENLSSNGSEVVAYSDRTAMTANNLSIIKIKNEDDESLNCGISHGNRKLYVPLTRSGPGLYNEEDYISLVCELRPGFDHTNATGRIREGFTYKQIVGES